MVVMDILDCFRAKSKNEDNYLLKDHLKETINRAIELKKFVDKNRDKIRSRFDDLFFEKLIFACFLHDLGKINWKFQKRVYSEEEKILDSENGRYRSQELNKLNEFFRLNGKNYKKIDIRDHEVISLIYSLLFLDDDSWDQKIRTAVLLHHYNEFYINREVHIRNIFDDYPDLKKYVKFLIEKKDKVNELLTHLLDYLKQNSDETTKEYFDNLCDKLKVNFKKIEELNENIENGHSLSTKLKLFAIPDKESDDFYDFFVFLGCLRRCDYAASGNVEIEELNNLGRKVYNKLNNNIKEKLKQSGELWQEKVLEKKDSNNLILIAPTGSGKTEFALLWAKNRGKKLIYTLPLRVALNDLFGRFGKRDKYFDENDVDILHSTAFVEYLKEERLGESVDIGARVTGIKMFSSPILLTTPDQVFLSSLKYYGFDKLFSVYPLSSIVIDEIQAYKPEMAAVIIKTIEAIKKTSGDVLVITATFPPYLKEYFKDFTYIDLKEENEIKNKVKNYKIKRHKIMLKSKGIFEYNNKELAIKEDSLGEIKNIIDYNKSKNILIIVNNVGKSIELFKELEKDENIKSRMFIGDDVPLLLHSRIIEKEKSIRIKEIKKKLDKKEKGMILVSTQLVEASVDVDFDILITEISPIDSQIQRWGRIYRNRENEGDYEEKDANIYIFSEIDKGTEAIYDKNAIEITSKILEKNQNKCFGYEDERDLIEKVFSEKIENSSLRDFYIQEINKNLEWLKYYSIEKRDEAQRIFRNIAGLQVVCLDLIDKSEDEIEKAFVVVLREDTNNWDLPWKELENKVKEKLKNEELKKQVNKWKLLATLYSYSFNLPIYSFENSKYILHKNLKELKGFFVMDIKQLEYSVNEIKKYGVVKLSDIDIDKKEIEINQSVI
ncbi:MAG: CRISPR-associated helicase Cas3' [Candidatus Ratteibacteria bacterium]